MFTACLPGYPLDSGRCVACPKGTYDKGTYCQQCPWYTTTVAEGSTSYADCSKLKYLN